MADKISIIIPVYNEAQSIVKLHDEVVAVMKEKGHDFEIVFVDDGSTDDTKPILKKLQNKKHSHLKVIYAEDRHGKATALSNGFSVAEGNIIITMDGDLQDDPHYIPHFIAKLNEGYDLVSGWKQDRQDPINKRVSSKIYNMITSTVTGIHLHDHNSGYKAYRRDVALALPLGGQLHRYVTLLAHAAGFEKITEISVVHRKRPFGKSKYGASRLLHAAVGLHKARKLAKRMRRIRTLKHTHHARTS